MAWGLSTRIGVCWNPPSKGNSWPSSTLELQIDSYWSDTAGVGNSCVSLFLHSYTYWWTTGVLKHLPLPFDEGMNSVCSLPCRVSWKWNFSHKCFLTVSSPKPEKSTVSTMVDKSVPHPCWAVNCHLQVARDTWLAKTWPPCVCVPRRTSSYIFFSVFITV